MVSVCVWCLCMVCVCVCVCVWCVCMVCVYGVWCMVSVCVCVYGVCVCVCVCVCVFDCQRSKQVVQWWVAELRVYRIVINRHTHTQGILTGEWRCGRPQQTAPLGRRAPHILCLLPPLSFVSHISL